MPRARITVVVAASTLLVCRLSAQGPPDFSGSWVSSMPGSYPTEKRMTITQSAGVMTLRGTVYRIQASTGANKSTYSETPYPMTTTYLLDGLEHPCDVVVDAPPFPVPPATGMTTTMEESLCKASWAGGQLVFMRYEKQRLTAPGQTPPVVILRQTVRETLEVGPDGSLVSETVGLRDPLPWSPPLKSPTPIRRVYKRSSQ